MVPPRVRCARDTSPRDLGLNAFKGLAERDTEDTMMKISAPTWDRAANIEATVGLFKAAEMAGFLAFGATVAIVRGTGKEDVAYTELELHFLRAGYSPGTAKNYLSKVKACVKNAPVLEVEAGETFEDYAQRMATALKRLFGAVRDIKQNPNAKPAPRESSKSPPKEQSESESESQGQAQGPDPSDVDAVLTILPTLDKSGLELVALALQECFEALDTTEPLKAAA